MLEPVKLADFFTVFFSAASVILFGASYALMFAWSRVRNRPRLMPLAYAAYVGLFISVLALAVAANLFHNTFWTVIVLLMLVGYLLAPHAIWHLCVGTHADQTDALTPNPSPAGGRGEHQESLRDFPGNAAVPVKVYQQR